MSYDEYDAARDQWLEDLYREHKQEILSELTGERMRSYFLANRQVAQPAFIALNDALRLQEAKFFADAGDSDIQVAEALIVADGLREAARLCKEGQAAVHARLVGGAEVIERLCRSREVAL